MPTKLKTSTVYRIVISCFLCMVMLSVSASGFFVHSTKARTEWNKVTFMPAMVEPTYTICDKASVVYTERKNIVSEGVIPEVVAKCRSPGSFSYHA